MEVSSSHALVYFKRAGLPIVAPATALGGPVAVLRLSGRDLSRFEPVLGSLPPPGTFELRAFRAASGGATLDRGLLLYFKAPQSFTGEDVVEIQMHGVSSLVEKIQNELVKLGAESALPGEFSFRAVMNEKMSLAEAEALQASLATEGLGASSAATLLNLPTSSQARVSARLETAIKAVESARGRIEAAIDFSEAETEQAHDVASAQERVERARLEVIALLTAFESFAAVSGEPTLVILGEPNVGKSTLINRLLGGERALVSPMAGTTRDLVEGRMRLEDGTRVRLVDTAGLREIGSSADAHEAVERDGIERGLEVARQADALLVVLKSGDSGGLDRLRERFGSVFAERPVIPVYSHADQTSERSPGHFDLRSPNEGVESYLRSQFANTLSALREQTVEATDVAAISKRQHRHLLRCLEGLDRARSGLNGALPLEICGDSLRDAELELKAALGRDLGEAYIEAIFREFCLGK